MTRVEARIAVRMLGVLVIGLSIHPMLSSVVALPWVLRMTGPAAANGGLGAEWHWMVGFFLRALFYSLCVLFGVFLDRRAGKVSALIFPGAAA